MKSRHGKYLTIGAATITALILGPITPVQFSNAADPQEVTIQASTDGIVVGFATRGNRELLTFSVRIVGPDQFIFEQRTRSASLQWIPPDNLTDGWYNWEAWVVTADPGALTRELTSPSPKRSPERLEDNQTHLASGSFRIENGLLLDRQLHEEEKEPSLTRRVAAAILEFMFPSAHAQKASFANGMFLIGREEDFGPELWLLDTSNTGDPGAPQWRMRMTYPANHLELNYCVIDDITLGCTQGTEITPLTIRNNTGRVGVGTSTPNSRLHVNSAYGEAAFRAQINDQTRLLVHQNGGVCVGITCIPPSRGLHVYSGGNSGFGTTAPTAPIHVRRFDDTFEMLFLEQSNPSVIQDRNMIQLDNNGGIRFQFDNNALGTSWRFQAATGNQDVFEIAKVGTGVIEMKVDANGNLTTAGTVNGASSRGVKNSIEPVDSNDILMRLRDLAVAEWTYNRDPDGLRHLGPMAEDFYSAFGLGVDDKHIAPSDLAGVALAAAKALIERNEEQRDLINVQGKRIQMQDERITELESQNRMIRSNLVGLEELRVEFEQLKASWPSVRVALEN